MHIYTCSCAHTHSHVHPHMHAYTHMLLFLYFYFYCRELKRLSTVTLSPIYAHFSESLNGLTVIRAMRVSEEFADENRARLEINQRANFGGK